MRPILLFLALLSVTGIHNVHAKDGQLQFITNGHQWPSQVRYKADVQGGSVFLTNNGFMYSYYSLQDLDRIHELKHENGKSEASVANEIVHGHAYSVTMRGCNTNAPTIPQQKLPNYYNYFLGNDQSKWSTGLAAYEGINYQNIYNGIDLNVYSKSTSLKYDFIVAPGADASVIKLVFNGTTPTLTSDGDLSIKTTVNELLEKAPYAYQMINGTQQKVDCKYVLNNGQVSFSFPNGYDPSKQLIIDPVLVFATYSGGTGSTYGWSATYDLSGALYAGGECFGVGWPVSTGAFQTTFGGNIDDGINKYSSTGNSLIYSTYYGGSAGDYPNTMVVTTTGELIMAGATASTNLPTTTGCYDNTANGATDLYVVHFNATGTALIGSTYIGGSGSEGNQSIAGGYDANRGEVYVDATGNIYVAAGTTSTNFPTTTGAYQTTLSGTMDAFIIKLNSNCSSLLLGTYLGGSANDAALAILTNSAGNIVVCGGTASTNFPGVTSGWQTASQGGNDGFIAILNSTGSTILNATYVGTSGNDNVSKIQLDPFDNIYAMGINGGTFPVSTGAYNVAGGKIYMAKFSPALSNVLTSTTIGSATITTTPSAFLLDVCGNVYYVGYGASAGLPLTANAYQTAPGGFWMCVLTGNMTALSYASYFGAGGDHLDGGTSRMDPQGIVYHSICTSSTALPTTPSSYCPTKLASGFDIASWKFNFQAIGVYAGFSVGTRDTFCSPALVTLTNNSTGGQSYVWKFGDGTPNYTGTTPPPHSFTAPGLYRIGLYAYNSGSCVGIDSTFHNIYIRADSVHAKAALTTNDSGCIPYNVAFNNTTTDATSFEWIWGDNTPNSTTINPTHTFTISGTYTIRLVAINPDKCRSRDTVSFVVTALIPGADAVFSITGNDSLCMPASVQVTNSSTGSTNYQWDFGDNTPVITAANPPAHTYTNAGTYTIKLRAYNTSYWACIPIDSAIQVVHVFEILTPVLTVTDTLVCVPDKIDIKVNIANYQPSMNIAWSPLAFIYSDPTRAQVTVDGTRDQLYTVVVTNSIPGICTVSATADMRVNLWNKFVYAGDTMICAHDTIELHVNGVYDSVRWMPDLYISNPTSLTPKSWPQFGISYTLFGKYHHCVDTERIVINIAPSAFINLPDSVVLYPDDSYQMNPGTNCLYFSWFPFNGLNNTNISNPIAMPEVNTRYFITARTELGCDVRDSIDVIIAPDSYIDVPNAFAPGSGPNGRLNVVHRGNAQLKSFQVFDRWGIRVYQTSDINDGWDGTFKGTPQPMGVYVYMAEALTPAGKRFYKQGNVTLIR